MAMEQYEQFLDELEIGNDGTVFYPETIPDCKNFFSLDVVLKHAFSLFYYHFVDTILEYSPEYDLEKINLSFLKDAQLMFSKILQYCINARRVLTEMNHYDGDQLLETDNDLKIYKNPKNNTVIDFKKFMEVDDITGEYKTSLTTEVLREQYGVSTFEVISLNSGNAFKIVDNGSLELIDINGLSAREGEAFYGRYAQMVMGWIPSNLFAKKVEYQKFIKNRI